MSQGQSKKTKVQSSREQYWCNQNWGTRWRKSGLHSRPWQLQEINLRIEFGVLGDQLTIWESQIIQAKCLQNTVWYNRVCYSCSQDILTLEEHQISVNFQVVIQMAMYYEAHQPESLFCRMTKRFSFPFQSRETKWVRKWKVFFWCWILHSDAEVADSPIRGKLLGCVYFTVKLGTQNLPPNNTLLRNCMQVLHWANEDSEEKTHKSVLVCSDIWANLYVYTPSNSLLSWRKI